MICHHKKLPGSRAAPRTQTNSLPLGKRHAFEPNVTVTHFENASVAPTSGKRDFPQLFPTSPSPLQTKTDLAIVTQKPFQLGFFKKKKKKDLTVTELGHHGLPTERGAVPSRPAVAPLRLSQVGGNLPPALFMV